MDANFEHPVSVDDAHATRLDNLENLNISTELGNLDANQYIRKCKHFR